MRKVFKITTTVIQIGLLVFIFMQKNYIANSMIANNKKKEPFLIQKTDSFDKLPS